MHKDSRQQHILHKLNFDRKVSLISLSQELEVSYDSIRRDVIELQERGMLKKVHGGVIANSFIPMNVRREIGINSTEIEIIAAKAQKLFEDGQTILMDGGTTNIYVAEQIPKSFEGTIITNNPRLALSLIEHTNTEVILLGGSFHKRYQITAGSDVIERIGFLRVDTYFMGVVGISVNEGLTLRDYEETMMKRQMIQKAAKIVVCAGSEKMSIVANHRICDYADIDTLITNYEQDSTLLQDWRGRDVEVL